MRPWTWLFVPTQAFPRQAEEIPRQVEEFPCQAEEIPRRVAEFPCQAEEIPRQAEEIPISQPLVRRFRADTTRQQQWMSYHWPVCWHDAAVPASMLVIVFFLYMISNQIKIKSDFNLSWSESITIVRHSNAECCLLLEFETETWQKVNQGELRPHNNTGTEANICRCFTSKWMNASIHKQGTWTSNEQPMDWTDLGKQEKSSISQTRRHHHHNDIFA